MSDDDSVGIGLLKTPEAMASWADVLEQLADELRPSRKRTRLMTYSLMLRSRARTIKWLESPSLIPPRPE